MGVGKSTVGVLLAELSGRPLVDVDTWIAHHAGQTIPEIFSAEGEGGFRQRERAAIRQLEAHPAAVVALGGGAVVDPANRRRIRALGQLITLTASPETIRARLGVADGRPLAQGDPLARLSERAAAYADADGQVATDHRTPADVAQQIHAEWLS